MTAEDWKLPHPPSATGWIQILAVIGWPLSKYAVFVSDVACAPGAAPSAISPANATAADVFFTMLEILILTPRILRN